jgi:hypothetical protein
VAPYDGGDRLPAGGADMLIGAHDFRVERETVQRFPLNVRTKTP